MPSQPPLSAFDAILHEHVYFAPTLAAATAAADRLALDPANRHARQQARSALRFIRTHALPHMRYEEAVLFPRAVDHGAPGEVIALLVRDHEVLRSLAGGLDTFDEPGAISPGQVELLRRFVQLFEQHLTREEELMTTLAIDRVAPLLEHP